MKLFGLELPSYFDGKPWAVGAATWQKEVAQTKLRTT
jgi:hypothetical protein